MVKKTQHCEMASAVNQVGEGKPETADIIIIESPIGDQESDLENENDNSLCVADLLNKVSFKLEVFNVHKEDLSDDDDSNDDNVETTAPLTSNNAKKRKPHKMVKWEKKHLNSKPTSKPDQNKRAQSLLEHPENVGLTVWSSFEKVFLDIAFLLFEETNRYANKDKNKKKTFNVTLNDMLDFVGLIFLYGYNIRLSEKDY